MAKSRLRISRWGAGKGPPSWYWALQTTLAWPVCVAVGRHLGGWLATTLVAITSVIIFFSPVLFFKRSVRIKKSYLFNLDGSAKQPRGRSWWPVQILQAIRCCRGCRTGGEWVPLESPGWYYCILYSLFFIGAAILSFFSNHQAKSDLLSRFTFNLCSKTFYDNSRIGPI